MGVRRVTECVVLIRLLCSLRLEGTLLQAFCAAAVEAQLLSMHPLARADALEHPLIPGGGFTFLRVLYSSNLDKLSCAQFVVFVLRLFLLSDLDGTSGSWRPLKGLVPIITAAFVRWVVRFLLIDSYWKSMLPLPCLNFVRIGKCAKK